MTVESRLTIVEESLRLLRDASRLQSRPLSAAAPAKGNVLGWNATTKKWEPTLIAPTVIIQTCTSDTSISSSTPADITGVTSTFTPSVVSTAIVWVVIDSQTDTADDSYAGHLDVDGSDETAVVRIRLTGATDRKTMSQMWMVALTAASHTIKLQGSRIAGSGTQTVFADHTRMMIFLIDDSNVTIS